MTTERQRLTDRTALRSIVLGLVLLSPAGLCWISRLVVPTVRTVITSLQADSLREAQFVGLGNYARLFQDVFYLKVFSSASGFTLLLIAVRVVMVAVVPLLLAFAVNEFGRVVRIPVRLLFTVPLALFAPVASALTWSMALHPRFGLVNVVLQGLNQAPQQWLAGPKSARAAFLFVDGLTTFGLACGVGLIFYLAALRGSGEGAPTWKKVWAPVAASWVMGLLAAIALSLQSFTMSYTLTAGGPGSATTTLGVFQFILAFKLLGFGTAATVATLTLIVLALLGLVVGLIVVLAGLRLEMVPREKRSGLLSGEGKPSRGKTVAIALLAVTLLVSLGICSLSVLPLPWNALNSLKTEAGILGSPSQFFPSSPSLDAYAALGEEIPIGRVLINTIVPPLLVLLVQILIAYMGALGIGAMRPFGKWSELLLLPFGPWLFVTVGPLSIAAFQSLGNAGRLNTFTALLSPILLSVPALFILTLFFKGQEPRWSAAQAEGESAVGTFFSKLVVPSLPLVALLACVSFLVGLQGLLWPFIVAAAQENYTANVSLLVLRNLPAPSWPMLAAGLTLFGLPAFVFFFLIFGLFQSLYLDRLALVTHPVDIKE